VRVAERTMLQFLQHHEVKPYRPTYRFLKGDPVRQQTACEELAALGEERSSQGGRAA
jgi:hypothetical protein